MAALPNIDAAIRRLQSEPGKTQTEYRDPKTPGLSLIVGKTARSWSLMYVAPDGKRKRVSFGRYPAVGLAKARERAQSVFASLHDDVDPAARRKAYRAGKSINEAVDEFIDVYSVRKADVSKKMDEAVLRNDLVPEIGDRKLVDVTRSDVQKVIRRVQKRGSATMANRTLAIVRKFLGWSVEQGWIDTNPAAAISRPNVERPRTRTLSDAELEALWKALEKLSPQAHGAFKLLLLTGQREMEVVQMHWSEIDLERGLWTLPADGTGRSKMRSAPHLVPLAPAAVDVLGEIRKLNPDSETVLRARVRNGKQGPPSRSIVTKAKVRLDTKFLQFDEPWRIHDLRRTVRTGLSQLSVPPHVSELVIGHAASGLVRVYDHYDYLAEKRDALTRWADHLLTIVGERPACQNVVPINAEAKASA